MKPNFDPNLLVWVPEYVLSLINPEKFWLCVLWISKHENLTLQQSYEELEETFESYYGRRRYSDVTASRRAYTDFRRKAGKKIHYNTKFSINRT